MRKINTAKTVRRGNERETSPFSQYFRGAQFFPCLLPRSPVRKNGTFSEDSLSSMPLFGTDNVWHARGRVTMLRLGDGKKAFQAPSISTGLFLSILLIFRCGGRLVKMFRQESLKGRRLWIPNKNVRLNPIDPTKPHVIQRF